MQPMPHAIDVGQHTYVGIVMKSTYTVLQVGAKNGITIFKIILLACHISKEKFWMGRVL